MFGNPPKQGNGQITLLFKKKIFNNPPNKVKGWNYIKVIKRKCLIILLNKEKGELQKSY